MAQASVTGSVVVPAPLEVVWAVVIDPEVIPRLDPRLTLMSSTGTPGEVGSEYVLRSPRGEKMLDLHYRVDTSSAPTALTTEVTIEGRNTSWQEVALARHDDGTRLTWTTRTRVPWVTLPLAKSMARTEMDRWLAALSAHAASRT